MTRRRRMTVAEKAAAEAQEAENRAEVARLRAAGATVVVGPRSRVVSAARRDVFDILVARGSITEQHRSSARRLEADYAARYGVDRDAPKLDRVDGVAPGAGLTDRMVAASERIERVMERVGVLSGSLLRALILPQFLGVGEDWRCAVQLVTGERNPVAQAAAVRHALENLRRAYEDPLAPIKRTA